VHVESASVSRSIHFDSMLIENGPDDLQLLDPQATLLLSNNVIGVQT